MTHRMPLLPLSAIFLQKQKSDTAKPLLQLKRIIQIGLNAVHLTVQHHQLCSHFLKAQLFHSIERNQLDNHRIRVICMSPQRKLPSLEIIHTIFSVFRLKILHGSLKNAVPAMLIMTDGNPVYDSRARSCRKCTRIGFRHQLSRIGSSHQRVKYVSACFTLSRQYTR